MRRRTVGACVAVLAAGIASMGASAARAAPTGPVHPGVQTFTAGAQCTANFIFKDATSTYIGQAAHCSGTGAATETNGCDAASLPIGTAVTVTGASKPGTLVYNSWIGDAGRGRDGRQHVRVQRLRARQARCGRRRQGRSERARLRRADGRRQRGGGRHVFSYGNSSLRQGITQLSPKQGLVVQIDGGGWSRTVYTVTPGIPGDSGSGFMNASGQAIGVLSTLTVLPLPLSNGVGDLSRELAYARAHAVRSACSSSTGRSRSRATWWARSSGSEPDGEARSPVRRPGRAGS